MSGAGVLPAPDPYNTKPLASAATAEPTMTVQPSHLNHSCAEAPSSEARRRRASSAFALGSSSIAFRSAACSGREFRIRTRSSLSFRGSLGPIQSVAALSGMVPPGALLAYLPAFAVEVLSNYG